MLGLLIAVSGCAVCDDCMVIMREETQQLTARYAQLNCEVTAEALYWKEGPCQRLAETENDGMSPVCMRIMAAYEDVHRDSTGVSRNFLYSFKCTKKWVTGVYYLDHIIMQANDAMMQFIALSKEERGAATLHNQFMLDIAQEASDEWLGRHEMRCDQVEGYANTLSLCAWDELSRECCSPRM